MSAAFIYWLTIGGHFGFQTFCLDQSSQLGHLLLQLTDQLLVDTVHKISMVLTHYMHVQYILTTCTCAIY